MRSLGCTLERQRGSHRMWRTPDGRRLAVVPAHAGEDLRPGTLAAIERALEPSLDRGWLRTR